MLYINPSDCPRDSLALWMDGGPGHLTFMFTPQPTIDGMCYCRVSRCCMEEESWPAAMEAANRAGWKFEAVARVRYTDQVLCEVKPIPTEGV